MYKLARLMLIMTVVACCYCVVIAAMRFGGFAYIIIPLVILGYVTRRKPGVYTAHGTARWADASKICGTPEWWVPGVG